MTGPYAHQGRFRIQSLLVGLLAFTLIGSTVILMAVSIHRQNEMLMRTTQQKNFEAARNLATSVNTIKSLMFQQLGGTANYIAEEGLSVEGDSRRLGRLLLGSRMFNGAMVVDSEGQVSVTTPETGYLKGDQLAASDLFPKEREPGPWMSKPFIAPDGHRVILAMHQLTMPGKQKRLYLSGLIDLGGRNVFSDMFEHTIKSGPGTYAYLVDGQGEMLMNAQENRAGEAVPGDRLVAAFERGTLGQRGKQGGTPPPPPSPPPPANGKVGKGAIDGNRQDPAETSHVAILADGHGVETIVGYLPVGDLDWGLVVQSSASIVTKSKHDFLMTQLKWCVPLIAAFLLLSLWMARKLAAPFAQLTAAARAIASGDRAGYPLFDSHWNYEAHHLARAMMMAVQGLQNQADRLSQQAHTDRLTGLANRAGLEDWLKAREGDSTGYTLLVIDIDHFKTVNDKHGHKVGDETLVYLAHILQAECRETDLVCRLGGEEFIAILPGEKMKGGTDLAEKVRIRTESTVSPTGQPITVSIGVAAASPERGFDFERTFQRADEALYAAKRSGRNRTMASA
ncbi:diguanylate cyclase (GGDEF)-like protein [Paenibacillus taihuensis]|uniref:Diguanylate cyclase (GGDEF)-like protein n=1 Tax=Paenibacillus taihuensis TaxID=1156355 RepID=A0A3D9S3J5_9BACL|nr:sensor domain-containing diguanylate cyclase [Paenibacillus taihuensis]REE83886.1 diguanylate cyclase (GGDEF)-like protein [Paenibacillus taihuensis]